MSQKKIINCIVLFIIIASSNYAYSQIFKWKDENGRIHYSDKVPEKYKNKASVMENKSQNYIYNDGRLRNDQKFLIERTKKDQRLKLEKSKEERRRKIEYRKIKKKKRIRKIYQEQIDYIKLQRKSCKYEPTGDLRKKCARKNRKKIKRLKKNLEKELNNVR